MNTSPGQFEQKVRLLFSCIEPHLHSYCACKVGGGSEANQEAGARFSLLCSISPLDNGPLYSTNWHYFIEIGWHQGESYLDIWLKVQQTKNQKKGIWTGPKIAF